MSLMLGTKLADLRKRHGFSQEVLAEKMGVSRQAVSKWERGESTPDTDTLIELARLYEVSLDELVGNQNNNEDAKKSSEKKHKKDDKKNQSKQQLYPGLSSKLLKFPFPIVTVAVYILLGFTTHLWHPMWLLFLTIPAYYHFAIGARAKTKKGFLLGLPVFEAALILFLVFGLFINGWKWAWILFIIALCYYWWVMLYVKKHN